MFNVVDRKTGNRKNRIVASGLRPLPAKIKDFEKKKCPQTQNNEATKVVPASVSSAPMAAECYLSTVEQQQQQL